MPSAQSKVQHSVPYQVALQVRLGSQRLPRKALLPLPQSLPEAGPCVLDWVLYHLSQSQRAERFLLLCPESDMQAFEPYARHYGFVLFGGSECDVLERFCRALERYPARYCFRVTADNPLLHGSLLDFMVRQLECDRPDISDRLGNQDAPDPAEAPVADYYWIEGLPYGFAAELFRPAALLRLAGSDPERELASQLEEQDREHVTRFLYRQSRYFTLRRDILSELLGVGFADLSQLRLSLDIPEDYRFLQRLFDRARQSGWLPERPAGLPVAAAGGQQLFFARFLLVLRKLALQERGTDELVRH